MNYIASNFKILRDHILNYFSINSSKNNDISIIISTSQVLLSLVCVAILLFFSASIGTPGIFYFIIIGNFILLAIDIIFRSFYSQTQFNIRYFIAFYMPFIMFILCIISIENIVVYNVLNGLFFFSIVFSLCFFIPNEIYFVWSYLLIFYLLFFFRIEISGLLFKEANSFEGFNNSFFEIYNYARIMVYAGIISVFYFLDKRHKQKNENNRKAIQLQKIHYKILVFQEKQLELKCEKYNKQLGNKRIDYITTYNFFENIKKIQKTNSSTWAKQILLHINDIVDSHIGYLINVNTKKGKVNFSSQITIGVLLENKNIHENSHNVSLLHRCYTEKNFIHIKDDQSNYNMANVSSSLGSSKTNYRLFIPVLINNEVISIFLFIKHTKWESNIIYQLKEITDLVSGLLLHSSNK